MNKSVSGCSAFFVCQRSATRNAPARVALKYTKGDWVLPKEASLASFCFPVTAEMHATKRVAASEVYCFTMTKDTGDRMHGFCRRIYWSASSRTPKFPVVLCVVSDEIWSIFHFKVLEVLEQLLLQERFIAVTPSLLLPPQSAAAKFLKSVNEQLASSPQPGSILRIPFPNVQEKLKIEAPKKINTLNFQSNDLRSTSDFIELQVPPLTGGSPEMAGVSLARLMWRIPIQSLMTLIASLLLERRIIMVSTSKDTLSAAIHAASALIYPFEWPHRFYLPIMPECMRDHLQAPFPFLVGLPAELMEFRGLEMDEVTLIDLDLGTCTPESGSAYDDAHHLPMKTKLEAALHDAVRALRSPSEFEGNTRISEVVTGYVVRLFKNYRQFISKKGEPALEVRDRGLFSAKGCFRGNGKSMNNGTPSPERQRPALDDRDEEGITGHGYFFDHSAFVAAHRSKKDRAFLDLFRQSQMYEVFIQQRLEMASLGVYPKDDPFEYKINLISEHSKLNPGNFPHRNWSRRISSAALSRTVTNVAETKIRNAQMVITEEFLYEPKSPVKSAKFKSLLWTKSRKRLTLGKGRDKRFSKRQSIKNIVTEMAKQSSQKPEAAEPGNFLQRSRASFAERDVDDIPQFEYKGSVRFQFSKFSGPLIKMEEEDSETTESDEPISAVKVSPRDIRGSLETPELSVESPWQEEDNSNIFDLCPTSEAHFATQKTNRFFGPLKENTKETFQNVSVPRMVQPERSVRLSAAVLPGNEKIPSDLRFENEDEKERQADEFLESNLNGLSSDSVRLGLPPKPQQSSKSLGFR